MSGSSEESRGSCACSCDEDCGRSLSPTSFGHGAESTSGCPSSSDYLPSDPVSGSLSPGGDKCIAGPRAMRRSGWGAAPPPLPEKRKPALTAITTHLMKAESKEAPSGGVRPRITTPPVSSSPSERCWWEHQQLSPVSCASGFWEAPRQQPPGSEEHRSSSSGSDSEETEKMKALFMACDSDGDGYITR